MTSQDLLNASYDRDEDGNEQTEEVKRLLQIKDVCVNDTDSNDDSPLILAAGQGHVEIVKLLLAAGAKLEYRNSNGETALTSAAGQANREVNGGHLEVVQVLLDAGSEVDRMTKDSETALYQAGRHGHEDIAEVLLRYGAKVDKIEKTLKHYDKALQTLQPLVAKQALSSLSVKPKPSPSSHALSTPTTSTPSTPTVA